MARASAARWPARRSAARDLMSRALLLVVIACVRACPSATVGANAAFDEGFQRRQVLLRDAPDNIGVGRVIGMTQLVPEIDHSLPLDIRCVAFDVIGEVRC